MSATWLSGNVIGLSVSEAEDLLGLGYGNEHLRELLLRVGQALLRAGADLAYGGHFKKNSFTRDLINLISEEQQERIGEQAPWIGMLYNHSAWPFYEDISDEDEAAFIDSCRFVKITQVMAGIPADSIITGQGKKPSQEQQLFNQAVALSAMRRFMAQGIKLETGVAGKFDPIPPVAARVLVGGKVRGFQGVLPGLYEEALYCLEEQRPLYILGGFGGAGARLAGYLKGELDRTSARLELDELRQSTPDLATVEQGFEKNSELERVASPAARLARLVQQLDRVKKGFPRQLGNGLDRKQNMRLFETIDNAEGAALVAQGLRKIFSPAQSRKPVKTRNKNK